MTPEELAELTRFTVLVQGWITPGLRRLTKTTFTPDHTAPGELTVTLPGTTFTITVTRTEQP
ncbi:MAG: hypothetical protein BGO96_05370 [Micrococcales bacterium 73-15]|uniref:hypothetical protein n=1 Tax=Salana multivorans TaxID=120377 RepID=UPI00095A11B0|nr:hypothetical protein [Salana multivorans]OJX97362.1 MAG: hypothetical protein BGO96_05370 [Micrococcales bacterium 73-15]